MRHQTGYRSNETAHSQATVCLKGNVAIETVEAQGPREDHDLEV